MKTFATTALLALALLSPVAGAQDAYVDIEKRLSPAQMRETGLDRLSQEQLALLNRLLSDERASAVQQATVEARRAARAEAPRVAPARQAFESAIQGPFTGWNVGTVFTLANGQRWRVVDGSYSTGRVESPKVRLRPGLVSGFYLQVDGHSPSATVRLVK